MTEKLLLLLLSMNTHTPPPCAAEEISLGIIKGDLRQGGGVFILSFIVLAVIWCFSCEWLESRPLRLLGK